MTLGSLIQSHVTSAHSVHTKHVINMHVRLCRLRRGAENVLTVTPLCFFASVRWAHATGSKRSSDDE